MERSTALPPGLGRDWDAIVLIAWLSEAAGHPAAYVAAAWAIGIFQFAIGEAMLHEASHYNLFPSKRWNLWLEGLYALPFFRTVSQFPAEHNCITGGWARRRTT